ncbi:MAG: 16S rRNA processing protein RimM [Christensenellaceae bacterium]|nr:16S rRNA processing protein RimM [Christensenellaceae bacterium]
MDYFRLGQVLKPQGIKGEVKIKPFVDDLGRFDDLTCVYLKDHGQYEKREVSSARTYKQFAFLKIEGFDDRNQAELLRNRYLYVDRENAAPLPEGAYYIADLEGCRVEDEKGNLLGTLEEIFNTGGVDIYSVKAKKSFMFPLAPGVVLRRAPEEGVIVVDAARLAEVAVDA